MATVIPQVFQTPEHRPGESFQVDVLNDGTRDGLVAASVAYLLQAPPDVTGATLIFQGETIVLDAHAIRSAYGTRN